MRCQVRTERLLPFCIALATGSFSMLMGASVAEIFWAALLDLSLTFGILWSQKSKRVNLMLEPVTSFAAGIFSMRHQPLFRSRY